MAINEMYNAVDVYGVILEAAFEEAQNNHSDSLVFDLSKEEYLYLGLSEKEDKASLDDYIDGLYGQFEKAGYFDEYTRDDAVTNTAYASARTLRMMYNMCMAECLKNSLDEMFDGKNEKYTRLIADLGVPEGEKPELKERLKAYVDEKIVGNFASKTNQELAKALRPMYDMLGDPSSFLHTGLSYVYSINHSMLEGKSPEEAIKLESIESLKINPVANKPIEEANQGHRKLLDTLQEHMGKAINVVTDQLKANNTPVPKNNWFSANNEPLPDSFDANIVYNKDRGDVNPQEFLKRFSAGYDSLTPEDKKWASKIIDDIAYKYKTSPDSLGKNKGHVTITDFMSGGKPIVSDDDFREVQAGKRSHDDMCCKVVASMLSGKNVSLHPMETNKSWFINPDITQTQNEPTTILGKLWKLIKSLFDFSNTKEEIKAMNEKFRENQDIRKKTTFEDLLNQQAENNPISKKKQSLSPELQQKVDALTSPERAGQIPTDEEIKDLTETAKKEKEAKSKEHNTPSKGR